MGDEAASIRAVRAVRSHAVPMRHGAPDSGCPGMFGSECAAPSSRRVGQTKFSGGLCMGKVSARNFQQAQV
jgi:hypothetical protein